MKNHLLKLLLFVAVLVMAAVGALGEGGQVSEAASPQNPVLAVVCYYTYLPLVQGADSAEAAGPLAAPLSLECDDEEDPAGGMIDFNDDGYADLVIGIPYEDHSALVQNSGAVQVVYGTAAGLSAEDDQYWDQNSILGSRQAGELFGYALAAADFDGDGVTDLAIGSPGEDKDGMQAVGQVDIIYGYPTIGLTHNGSQTFRQGVDGIEGLGEAEDRFGDVLTTGDFNHDGFADLAIGVPEEDKEPENIAGMGAVHVIYGSALGLQPAGNQIIHLALNTVDGTPSANDHYGTALVAADFNGDGYDELAIGIPGYDIAGTDNVGAVQIFNGSGNGLSYVGETFWRQGFNGIQGAAEANDLFGQTLAAGDFDGNEVSDLVVGVPWEDVDFSGDNKINAGAFHVIFGYELTNGLSGSGDLLWHQGQDDILGQPEDHDQMAFSLAVADFDGNGTDDLAVGVPLQDGTHLDQGYVQVFYSNGNTLSTTGQDLWTQGLTQGAPEAEDYFGFSLGAGDFDGDNHADLVVGVPYEDVLFDGVNQVDAGAVIVIYGTGSGLGVAGNQVWAQSYSGLLDQPEVQDRFGGSLTK